MSFIIEDGVLKKYCSEKSDETDVVIPKGVTTIGEEAFANCDNLKSVKIPDSVISIEHGAFFECINLKSVKIPKSVEKIGRSAFECCYNLENVTIQNGVSVIETYAFSSCQNLTNIIIPKSLVRIECDAFGECEKLTRIYISNIRRTKGFESTIVPVGSMSTEEILNNKQLFNEKPDGLVVTKYGVLCGYKGDIETIIIPNGVKKIKRFFLWKKRYSIEISESVTGIEDCALSDVCIILRENGFHIDLQIEGFWWDSTYNRSLKKFLKRVGLTKDEYFDKQKYREKLYLDEFLFTKDIIKRQAIFGKMKKRSYKIPIAILMSISHEEDVFFHAYVKSNIKRSVKYLIYNNDMENLERILDLGYVTKKHIDDLINYALGMYNHVFCYLEFASLLLNYKKENLM